MREVIGFSACTLPGPDGRGGEGTHWGYGETFSARPRMRFLRPQLDHATRSTEIEVATLLEWLLLPEPRDGTSGDLRCTGTISPSQDTPLDSREARRFVGHIFQHQ